MKLLVNWTLYALFASVFLFDGFLGEGLLGSGLHLFPKKLSYSAELLSCAIALYLLIVYALKKKLHLKITYIVLFYFLLMHILVGITYNGVPSGAIFAGIRRYFIFTPLFFLPCVYEFSENEILNQLKILLFFGLLQCPVAIYQRFFIFSNHVTGDFVTGTFEISSILSLYQLFCIAILTAFYLKKKMKLPIFLLLMIILFVPTTLNETKSTIIFFPIAIFSTILFGTGAIINLKKIALITTAGLLIAVVFVPIYSHLYPQLNIISFFKGKGYKTRSFEGYLYKGITEEELGDKEPGRIDALLFALKILSKDPFDLVIGLGIGNTSPSGIKGFSGEYKEYQKYGAHKITATSLIWEIGLTGFLLHLLLLWVVLKDALTIRSTDDIFGILASGWIGVTMIVGISFFYKNILHSSVMVTTFWYISGLIAAYRTKNTAKKSYASLQTYNSELKPD
jgi:hypothetical protein